LLINDLTSDSAYNSITSFLNQLSQKATELGAAQNRLESALESNLVQMDNLTSSLSTIRDADISEVSSDFIRQQILQQAAATLMSTANQSPAIALQLI
jgi:flagellin